MDYQFNFKKTNVSGKPNPDTNRIDTSLMICNKHRPIMEDCCGYRLRH